MPSCSIGFWVARTKKGAGSVYVSPAAVTIRSCIAWRRAACVLGGVRLISSARTTLANTGPSTNRKTRRPVERSSSITSVPVMSVGMRSGVNWIRLNLRSSASASVEMRSVLASPGDADEEDVAVSEQRREETVHDLPLAYDALPDLVPELPGDLGHLREELDVTVGHGWRCRQCHPCGPCLTPPRASFRQPPL